MAEFKCVTCSESFTVPDEILEKYPGWTPRYCRRHLPEKPAAAGNATKRQKREPGGPPPGRRTRPTA